MKNNKFSEIDKILCGVTINSYNIFDAFLDISPKLYGKYYWYALRIAYSCSDNLYRYRDIVKDSFLCKQPYRDSLMKDNELKYLNELPQEITIYRGMTNVELFNSQFGVSWTLKKEVAVFFAEEYTRNISTNHQDKTVHKIKIDRSKVIAYFNGREEFEIIYLA